MKISMFAATLSLAGALAGCGEPIGGTGDVEALEVAAPAMAPATLGAPALIDTALSTALSTALPTQKLRVVATFSGPLSFLQKQTLTSLVSRVRVLNTLPMALIEATPLQITALRTMSGLVSLYLDKPLTYFLHESVPAIHADQVWSDLGIEGDGVTVAVVDSGIDGTHADLPNGEKVVKNIKIPHDAIGTIALDLPNSDTSSGHGTHVAGTVGGLGRASNGIYTGVAPGADLVGVGTGDALFIFSALSGFEWVLANKDAYSIDVVTNSWGTTGAYDPADPVNVASQKLNEAGIVVLFAAGNEGPGDNTLNPYSVAPWVISVAAGEKNGTTLADFSSRGIPGDAQYHPTVTAPGVDIVSTRSLTTLLPLLNAPSDIQLPEGAILSYTTMSGTSMATPHVAGVVALMLDANPDLTPAQVKQLLIDTATPMSSYAPHQVGAGYVNAFAATQQAANTN